jgi:hypothetical protein
VQGRLAKQLSHFLHAEELLGVVELKAPLVLDRLGVFRSARGKETTGELTLYDEPRN